MIIYFIEVVCSGVIFCSQSMLPCSPILVCCRYLASCWRTYLVQRRQRYGPELHHPPLMPNQPHEQWPGTHDAQSTYAWPVQDPPPPSSIVTLDPAPAVPALAGWGQKLAVALASASLGQAPHVVQSPEWALKALKPVWWQLHGPNPAWAAEPSHTIHMVLCPGPTPSTWPAETDKFDTTGLQYHNTHDMV